MSEGSGRLMKTLLVALAVALGTLVAVPAAAQAQDGNGGRDQYGNRGVGDRAEEDAVMASGSFSAAVNTESSDQGAAQAAEPPTGGSAPPEAAPAEDATAEAADGGDAGESGSAERPDITELPDTGGAPSLALGILLVAGGLLVGGMALFR
jgi:hypothetical protein